MTNMNKEDVVNMLTEFKANMEREFPWQDFDTIKTTTCILAPNIVDGVFFYPYIAYYMDIVSSEVKHITNKKKKIIPHDTTSGKIINVDCMGCIRGVVPDRKHSFRNCVMLDINSKSKIQIIKLCPETIHICGADEFSIEACNDLINHIKRVNYYLQYLRNNQDEARRMIEWIIGNTTGPVVKTFRDSSLIPISYSELSNPNVVNEIDKIYLHKRLCYNPKFFTRFFDDCFYPNDRIFDGIVNMNFEIPNENLFDFGNSNSNTNNDIFEFSSSNSNFEKITSSNDFSFVNTNTNSNINAANTSNTGGYQPPSNLNEFYSLHNNNLNTQSNNINQNTNMQNTYIPNMNATNVYGNNNANTYNYNSNQNTYNPNQNFNQNTYNPNQNTNTIHGNNQRTNSSRNYNFNDSIFDFNYDTHNNQTTYNPNNVTAYKSTKQVANDKFVIDQQSFFNTGINYVNNKKTAIAKTNFINKLYAYDDDLSIIESKECEYKEKYYDGYNLVFDEDDRLKKNIPYSKFLDIINLTLNKIENPQNKMYLTMKNGDTKIICADTDICTIISINSQDILSKIPDSFNKEIMEYLIKLCIDYVDHARYIEKLYSILDSNMDINLFAGDPKIGKTNFCTISLNYALGAPVDKIKMRDVFLTHPEFITEYDPTVDKNVTIRLKYDTKDIPPHLIDEIHINKETAFHTIIIYDTGEVTQSGPHIDLMIDVYNKFRHIVYERGHVFFTDRSNEKKKKKNKIEEQPEVKLNRAAKRKYNRYMSMETYYMRKFVSY